MYTYVYIQAGTYVSRQVSMQVCWNVYRYVCGYIQTPKKSTYLCMYVRRNIVIRSPQQSKNNSPPSSPKTPKDKRKHSKHIMIISTCIHISIHISHAYTYVHKYIDIYTYIYIYIYIEIYIYKPISIYTFIHIRVGTKKDTYTRK